MFANSRSRGNRPTLAADAAGNLSARMVKRPASRGILARIVGIIYRPAHPRAAEFTDAMMPLAILALQAVLCGAVAALGAR